MSQNLKEVYLDLLIRALTGELSDSVLYRSSEITKPDHTGRVMISLEACQELLRRADQEFEAYLKPSGKTASEYLDLDGPGLFSYLNCMNPIAAPHTMCGHQNALKVVECIESVLQHNVPGDVIETGVWKGGMTVLMRGVLKAHDCRNRKVWVADSFQGLPKPDPSLHLKDAIFWFLMTPIQQLSIPFEYVEALFQRYGLLDDQVQFLKG